MIIFIFGFFLGTMVEKTNVYQEQLKNQKQEVTVTKVYLTKEK